MKRLAILTSGGDAPGMNAAIRAATLLATAKGCEVYGVKSGYQGLIANEIEPLRPKDVSGIIREGGTILGSARCLDFHQRQGRDARRQEGLDGPAEHVAAAEASPSRQLEGRDLLQALRARLTEEEQAVAELRGQGKGWAEIAAALGGTADGRRMQMKRALDRVAPELGLDTEGDLP